MTRYHPAAGVRWQVGHVTVTLTDGRGHVRALGHPQAAIWDLVSRGYAFDKVVPMLAHIASVDPASARRLVTDALEDWHRGGYLERD